MPRPCDTPGCMGAAVPALDVCPSCLHIAARAKRAADLPVPRSGAEKMWAKIDKQPNGCWHWTGGINPDGYGASTKGLGVSSSAAHRAMYELVVGPIPKGMTLDHLCHTRNLLSCWSADPCLHRRCVNPSHLEVVTAGENARRNKRIVAYRSRREYQSAYEALSVI